ncbi:MAG: hypothetical protein C4519_13470 [Desulfobacteraceae bacterium]|nr:MAG: hypothetical protein C4519_13470 [Desulfobacteraceae bacterium]
MLLDQKLKSIQEEKNRLAVCADLRRHLVHLEVQGIRSKGYRTLSNLSLGLAVAWQVLGLLRERTASRR